MLRNILVPLDGSPLAEQALPYAVELALAARTALTLVRTAGVHRPLHRGLPHGRVEDATSYLRAHAERLRRDALVVEIAVAPGDSPEALVAEIERRRPDLVVMGTHGRSGLGRLLYGSVTEAVVSHGGRPVLLVRAWASTDHSDAPHLTGKRVLVPLDGSRFSEAALPAAVQLARSLGSDVLLLRAIVPVYPLPPSPEMPMATELDRAMWAVDAEDTASAYLARVTDQLATREHGVRVSSLARIGELTELIRELAASADAQMDARIGLVVMATHARSGLGRAILGSEADAVLRHDQIPLVVVRPPHAESAPARVFATSAREER